MKKQNIIGYVRVSTEDQAKEGVSLEMQRDKIMQYCKLREFNLCRIESDEGKSAKDLNRPGIHKILAAVKKDDTKYTGIVVYKLDRIFRSTQDALSMTKKLQEKGIGFFSIQENLDTASAMGKFFFTILAALAQMERELISERTVAALKQLKDTNRVYGTVPYGWKEEKGLLVSNLREVTIAKAITKKRYEQSWGYSSIARWLNLKRVPTRKGGNWYPQQIKNILNSNIGKMLKPVEEKEQIK